jgi:hypothetical protein
METNLKRTSVGERLYGLCSSHTSLKKLEHHVDETTPQSTLSG